MNKTPKLRFKEFSGDWESKKLSEYTEKITKKNKNFLVKNVISNSAKNGLVSQRDFFDKDIANQNNIDGYYIIENGDFVYNPRKSIESPYGPVNRYNLEDAGVVSPLYLCFKINQKINGEFLQYYFKSSKWYRFIYQNSDQGARHDRVSIKDAEFFNLDTKFPSIAEQEKIASFFSLIDKKIFLQSEKVEMLKEYKKGMMQKIFSRELRFKDDSGRDYPEWEDKKLSDIIDKGKAGGTPKSSVKDYYNGDINFLSISDMTSQGKYITNTEKSITRLGLENSSAWIVPKNSLIYSMYASVGFVSINRIELATSQAMFSMIINKNTNIDYVYQYLSYFKDNGVQSLIETGTQGNLNANTVRNISIPYPQREEQNKIASCISYIEDKINKEQEKLDSLNEYKKGLLQQMFV